MQILALVERSQQADAPFSETGETHLSLRALNQTNAYKEKTLSLCDPIKHSLVSHRHRQFKLLKCDIQDLIAFAAARRVDFDSVANFLADQRAGRW